MDIKLTVQMGTPSLHLDFGSKCQNQSFRHAELREVLFLYLRGSELQPVLCRYTCQCDLENWLDTTYWMLEDKREGHLVEGNKAVPVFQAEGELIVEEGAVAAVLWYLDRKHDFQQYLMEELKDQSVHPHPLLHEQDIPYQHDWWIEERRTHGKGVDGVSEDALVETVVNNRLILAVSKVGLLASTE
ncbi:unnamed protein product [Echinostoma caproni]|uniref:GST N-terminal domain-containing protein n=1 Tax=Echinostoma caproni TaxID=27848 RepID=A0A183B675_9TREM|nr:unnamed protein product [Echinostoma caproni]